MKTESKKSPDNYIDKIKLIILCLILETMLIVCIAVANLNPKPVLYFIFYNLAYGMIFSFLFVVFLIKKKNESWSSLGIKKMGLRQFLVLILYILFSTGGQLIPRLIAGKSISWNLLPMGVLPLIMTTFFEEFLFRGFIQSRIEQNFGCIAAIIVSGIMFSLYHLGYPGFRTIGDIMLLFAVGLGFAIAYKLSDHNLFVAYFVNLPNAFITYILKNEQFPQMNLASTISAFITLLMIFISFYIVQIKEKVRLNQETLEKF